MKDYSQYGEQQFITDYFKDTQGKFLDIGAYDGETFSNVRALIDTGWAGVMVEASPICFAALTKKLEEYTRIMKVCALITTGEQLDKLYMFHDANGDAVGTMKEENRLIWSEVVNFNPIFLAAISLDMLIAKFGNDFEFVNIDIEGGSADLFEEAAAKINAKMYCVEHDGQTERCAAIAARIGMKEVHMNGTNVIYAR